MIRILFVCHGNICRSPAAELVMKQLIAARRAEDCFFIASAATSREEIGNGIYPPMRRLLTARGIDCGKKTAVQVTPADGEQFDFIYCMDYNNLRNLQRILPHCTAEVALLGDYCTPPHEIEDPWYTGNFAAVLADITAACGRLAERFCAELQ